MPSSRAKAVKSYSSKPASGIEKGPNSIVASELDIPDCFRFLRSGSTEYDASDLSSVGESDYEIIGREPSAPSTLLRGLPEVNANPDTSSQPLPSAIPPPNEFDPPTDWRQGTLDAILGQERDVASEIRSIVGTPVADYRAVVEYLEELATPMSLTAKIENKLSHHKIVKVKLGDDTEMQIDKGAIFTHFLVSAFELVGVRECDKIVQKEMSFEAFMDCYERDKLSMSAHMNPRDDMPLFLRHLDHGYTFGWGAHIPGIEGSVDRWHEADLMHSSLQIYHSTFLRPYTWRQSAPGHSTAIRVRSGQLVLRLFNYPAPVSVSSRAEYFSECAKREADTSLCVVIEVAVGEMIIIPPGVMFDIFAPVATMTTTTWFLNYHCFHLSEMAMLRHMRSIIPYASQCTYYTASRMLCAARQYKTSPLRAKTLLGLCLVVSNPFVHINKRAWPDVGEVQQTIDWLFTLDNFGVADVNGYDIPEAYKYHPEGYEYKSLAVAHRVIKFMNDIGVGMPTSDQEDEEAAKDYLFGLGVEWTSPSGHLSEDKWQRLVIDSP